MSSRFMRFALLEPKGLNILAKGMKKSGKFSAWNRNPFNNVLNPFISFHFVVESLFAKLRLAFSLLLNNLNEKLILFNKKT